MGDSTNFADTTKRCSSASSSPSITEDGSVQTCSIAHTVGSIIAPNTAPFLAWSPILIPPWGPAILPAAFYPTALRNALPGFADVFAWRGRQTICERNQPDGLLNDHVKRIEAASTLNELKKLVGYRTKITRKTRKFLRFHSYKPIGHPKPKINRLGDKNNGSVIASRCSNQKRKLGSIKSDLFEDTEKGWKNICWSKKKATELTIDDDDDECLVQLASDWYDEGLLSHLRYLETIGERSAKVRREKKESAYSLGSSRFSVLSASSNTGNSARKLFTPVKHNGQPKRLSVKRCRKINICTYGETSSPTSDYRIRVEITSSAGRNSRIKFKEELDKALKEFIASTLDSPDSMNNFLSSNENYCIASKSAQVFGTNSDQDDHANVLINSLSQLEINRVGTLPTIVLTDFSSSQDTTATSVPFIIPPSDVKGSKPVNFDLTGLDGCLGIPNEKNYKSEARPP